MSLFFLGRRLFSLFSKTCWKSKEVDLEGGAEYNLILSLDSEMFLNLSSRLVLIMCPSFFYLPDCRTSAQVNSTFMTFISKTCPMSFCNLNYVFAVRA